MRYNGRHITAKPEPTITMINMKLDDFHYHQGRFSAKRENGVHHFHLLVHEFLTKKEHL